MNQVSSQFLAHELFGMNEALQGVSILQGTFMSVKGPRAVCRAFYYCNGDFNWTGCET